MPVSLPPAGPNPATTHRSRWRWVAAGARAGVSVPGLVLFASYIGFGGLLHGVGFPLGPGLLSTLLIWALPAQVILVGGLVAGNALPAIALAVGLSSIRLLPMVVAIAPYLRGRRRHLWVDLLCAHFVAMTVWVEGTRLLPPLPAEGRLPFAMGLGNALLGLALCGTLAGFLLAGELPLPLAGALLFLTPASFTILMVRGSQTPLDWMALGFGLVSAPLVSGLSGGLDLMIGGVGGGTLAYLVARWLRRVRR